MFDPCLTIFGPLSVDTHRPKVPQMRMNGHPVGKKKKTQPEVGVCKWEKCPRIRNSVRLAQDTAICRFQPAGHTQGPNEPILGPNGHRFGAT